MWGVYQLAATEHLPDPLIVRLAVSCKHYGGRMNYLSYAVHNSFSPHILDPEPCLVLIPVLVLGPPDVIPPRTPAIPDERRGLTITWYGKALEIREVGKHSRPASLGYNKCPSVGAADI